MADLMLIGSNSVTLIYKVVLLAVLHLLKKLFQHRLYSISHYKNLYILKTSTAIYMDLTQLHLDSLKLIFIRQL